MDPTKPPQAPSRRLWVPPPPNTNQNQRPTQAPRSAMPSTSQPTAAVTMVSATGRIPGFLPPETPQTRQFEQEARRQEEVRMGREAMRGGNPRLEPPRPPTKRWGPPPINPPQMEQFKKYYNKDGILSDRIFEDPEYYYTTGHSLPDKLFEHELRRRGFNICGRSISVVSKEVKSWVKKNDGIGCPGYNNINKQVGNMENYWQGMTTKEHDKNTILGKYACEGLPPYHAGVMGSDVDEESEERLARLFNALELSAPPPPRSNNCEGL